MMQNKVKTIIDAVNYFQGEFDAGIIYEYIGDDSIMSKGSFVVASALGESSYRKVCTSKEFNDLVDELSTNFGESVSYDEYKHEFEVKIIRDATAKLIASGDMDLSVTSKPVFTQAMADNGELPQVGSEILVYVKEDSQQIDLWFSAVCVGYYKSEMVARIYDKDDECYFDCFNSIYIRPIDTRTDKEKAIDKSINNLMFYGDQTQTKQRALDTLIAIREGKIHGVKWVGE